MCLRFCPVPQFCKWYGKGMMVRGGGAQRQTDGLTYTKHSWHSIKGSHARCTLRFALQHRVWYSNIHYLVPTYYILNMSECTCLLSLDLHSGFRLLDNLPYILLSHRFSFSTIRRIDMAIPDSHTNNVFQEHSPNATWKWRRAL